MKITLRVNGNGMQPIGQLWTRTAIFSSDGVGLESHHGQRNYTGQLGDLSVTDYTECQLWVSTGGNRPIFLVHVGRAFMPSPFCTLDVLPCSAIYTHLPALGTSATCSNTGEWSCPWYEALMSACPPTCTATARCACHWPKKLHSRSKICTWTIQPG